LTILPLLLPLHPGRRSAVQATRQLQRLGLPPALAARLAERNLQTARDLFTRTLLDLVELLDLPFDTVRQILQEVAARVTPPPQTALQLLTAAAGRPTHLRTSLAPLDEALFGGLPAGSVTEVSGVGPREAGA
jgi:hypothetical protein